MKGPDPPPSLRVAAAPPIGRRYQPVISPAMLRSSESRVRDDRLSQRPDCGPASSLTTAALEQLSLGYEPRVINGVADARADVHVSRINVDKGVRMREDVVDRKSV